MKNTNDTAFQFVRSLALELSGGRVDLPSFPEIVVRVRRVLADQNASLDKVVRVVGSEPALGARIVKMSNSASLSRGNVVTDLRTAINRLGYNMVRSAAMAFAMAQIRTSNRLKGLDHHLSELWQRSIRVAAFAFVLARTCTKLNPDEAMLTGMMHGIGKLYVLTRLIEHPELFEDANVLQRIIDDWHAVIGKAILENWEFSETMAAAVGEQHDLGRAGDGPPDLCDVIVAASVMESIASDRAAMDATLYVLPAARRLGLNQSNGAAVLSASEAEITALCQALGN